jgi:hypothetical protein
MIKKCLIILLIVLLWFSPCFAADYYVSESGSGGGTSCLDAAAISGITWGDGVGSSVIGAGDTLHLCGEINYDAGATGITVGADGTSDSPIVIKFETGAVLQSPRFYGPGTSQCNTGSCGGAINIMNHDYIIIDGGTNGIIQNTDSGSALTYQSSTYGLYARGTGITIQNLTIQNIYQNGGADPASLDTGGIYTHAVHIGSGTSKLKICNNDISAARMGIWSEASDVGAQVTDCSSDTFAAGVNIFLNTVDDGNWLMYIGGEAPNAPNIYANDFGDNVNWQCPSYPSGGYCTGCTSTSCDAYHTNSIHTYTGSSAIDVYIYSNYFHGDMGTANVTAAVHSSYNPADSNNASNTHTFNNVFAMTNGGITTWLKERAAGTTHQFLNNTLKNNSSAYNLTVEFSTLKSGFEYDFRNNIISTINTDSSRLIINSNGNVPWNQLRSNNNVWHYPGSAYSAWVWSGYFATIATWRAGCVAGGGIECDDLSYFSDPLLDASYKLQSIPSPASDTGANLTALCTGQMAPLCYDKPPTVGKGGSLSGANARPASGAWDIGAYEYQSDDTTAPAVTGFTLPSLASNLTVQISSFTCTDAVGVIGYKCTESATPPTAGSEGWTASAPSSYTFGSSGEKTLYPWCKDTAGNVSDSAASSDTVTISTICRSAPGSGPKAAMGSGATVRH